MNPSSDTDFDYLFKMLLIGDSGVGKSSLLLSFTSHNAIEDLSPTIGVDFKVKYVTVEGKKLKLAIWDTAGQERFRTLTIYDVTRRETFTNLSDVWAKEIDMHSTNQDCIKMLVGNKVDKILDTPSLIAEGSTTIKRNIFTQKPQADASSSACC
nr:Ras-related protein RABC1 [Tanacetum cinerariifolium]